MKTFIALFIATILTAFVILLLAAISVSRITPAVAVNLIGIAGEWYASHAMTVIVLGTTTYLLALGLLGSLFYAVARLTLRAWRQ